jgi:hypothetical protein
MQPIPADLRPEILARTERYGARLQPSDARRSLREALARVKAGFPFSS